MINPYVNNYDHAGEQNLIEDLVIEAIQMKGLNCYYMSREQLDIDALFNEDTSSAFRAGKEIEMYPAFVDGFDGDEIMSKFGLGLTKTATFVVSKSRFNTEFPEEGGRPREGALLFMPVTNAVMEIKKVVTESPFFERGKQYAYELKVEMFEYSYEDIANSGNNDVDTVLDVLRVPNQETSVEDFGSNDEIDSQASQDVEFDVENPFGVR